jgi:hypothetical protein
MATGVEPHYKGEVLNCVRNGRGSYRYEIGGNGLFVYDGLWMNGQKNGPHGKFTVKGAHQVTGDFREGEITGFGVKTWSDGRRYEGDWLNGEMNGKGHWISSNGDETYCGGFKDNKRHGFGVLTLTRTPSVYSGNFSFHKRDGLGSYLCPNLVFVEANFASNYVNGRIMVRWHDMAYLNGYCCDGLFENLCEFFTADNSYEFRGAFSRGLPLPLLEASYVHLQLDRSLVASKAIDVDQLTAASKKSALNTTKRVKAVEVEICLPQVQVGSELGILVLTSGTQSDIDCERQRIEESASAAAVLLSAVKPSKNTKSLTQITEPELGDPDCPMPAQKHSVPAERRRNVIVRVRQLCCGKNDGEMHNTPAAKGAVKTAAVEAKAVVPESYGDAIVFWLRGLSQEEFSSRSGRFPMASVAYVGGVLVAPTLGSLEDDFGVGVDTAATEALQLRQPNFSAACGAALRRAVKESNEFSPAVAVTSHALLSAPSACLPGGTPPGTTPSVRLRVPYYALHNAEKSVSVVADFCFNQSYLYDAAPAGEVGDGEQDGGETISEVVREITVITISKELLNSDATFTINNQSPKVKVSRSMQLVLLVPEKTISSAKQRYKTQAAIKVKAATQAEPIAREEAKTLRKIASSETATLHEKSLTSPKRKSTQVKKLAAHKEIESEELPKSPLGAISTPLPFLVEPLEEDFRDVEWCSCVWELRMITSSICCGPGAVSVSGAGTGSDMSAVGSIGPSKVADADTVKAEETESAVTVQRWEGGAVAPSDWHSIALTASRLESDSGAGTGTLDFSCRGPLKTAEIEPHAGSGDMQAKHHFQLVLNGNCLETLAPGQDPGPGPVSYPDSNSDVSCSSAAWLIDTSDCDAPMITGTMRSHFSQACNSFRGSSFPFLPFSAVAPVDQRATRSLACSQLEILCL